jgi:hypothetical protein
MFGSGGVEPVASHIRLLVNRFYIERYLINGVAI